MELLRDIIKLETQIENDVRGLTELAAAPLTDKGARDDDDDIDSSDEGGQIEDTMAATQVQRQRAQRRLKQLKDMLAELAIAFPHGTMGDEVSQTVAQAQSEHHQVHDQLRSRLRAVTLKLREKQQREYVQQRSMLLQGGRTTAVKPGARTDASAVLQASKDVTGRLRRTRRVMEDTAERFNSAATVLDSNASTLRKTAVEHRKLHGTLGRSATLVRKLEQRRRTDRILLIFGLILFFSVVAYILYKRVRYVLSFAATPFYYIPFGLFAGTADNGTAADLPPPL